MIITTILKHLEQNHVMITNIKVNLLHMNKFKN